MDEQSREERRAWQFSTRDLLAVMLMMALGMGWYEWAQSSRQEVARLRQQLTFAERAEKDRASRELIVTSVQSQGFGNGKGTLTGSDLTGANLRGVTIVGDGAAMQGTIFDDCDMRGVSMSGSFQGARFHRAQLARATLTGDASSFQEASFEGADLTGATLKGDGGAFQLASFAGAKVVGARIVCGGTGFQEVNIDGADFSGADLSAIDAQSLGSCYFNTPPKYDAGTRFPKEFDPAAEGWAAGE